jgi:glycosyltransferase involved in cell wall biosynthesis
MVSVIVPVYRAEKTLERCVGCILAQDYKDLELILIDDGSDDGSPALCDWLAKADSRIRTFHGSNTGAAGARNKGIELAKGEWICFVDSDDVLSPVFLSTLIRQLIDNDADIAVCAHEKCLESDIPDVQHTKLFFDTHTRKTATPPALYHGLDGLKALLYQRGFISAPWGMISARSLWKDLTFPVGTAAEDMGTIYRLFAAASTVCYTDRILYGYVQSACNTVFSTSSERNPDYYMHSHDMLDYVRSTYPDCTRAAESRHFSACFQILSETSPEQKDSELVRKIYDDIKALRRDVLFDKEARRRNRAAAFAVHFSIPAMHHLLYRKYKKEYPPS